MDEPLVEGDYTALVDLNIRATMKTMGNIPVGVYHKGVPLTVYQVYPEENGIVWGRVSSNTGSGMGRYVGLRVNNHVKAHLEKAFKPDRDPQESLAAAINNLAAQVARLADR